MKYYAGVGSRRTPADILTLMTEIAKKLASKGFVLRSGGADGADKAFERGAGIKEIFYAGDTDKAGELGIQAMNEAKKYHGAWSRCGEYARKLHARNVFQILGKDMKSPVDFVICWTPDGCIHHQQRTIDTGGTGTAISVASMHGIPVFNLARKDHLERIRKGLGI